MEFIVIDQPIQKSKEFELKQEYSFNNQTYSLEIIHTHEFGMSNYFWDIQLFRGETLVREAQIRSFVEMNIFSNQEPWVFLPMDKHIELFHLPTEKILTINYHKDLGLFTDYYLNQFDAKDNFLLTAFYKGFDLYDLNLERKVKTIESDTLNHVCIGNEKFIWADMMIETGQKLVKYNFDLSKVDEFNMPIPHELFNFDIEPYRQIIEAKKHSLKLSGDYGYYYSGLLNSWKKYGDSDDNIYVTFVPTSKMWIDSNLNYPCCEVEEKFIEIKK